MLSGNEDSGDEPPPRLVSPLNLNLTGKLTKVKLDQGPPKRPLGKLRGLFRGRVCSTCSKT